MTPAATAMASTPCTKQARGICDWTAREDKTFETALASLFNHTDRWAKLALLIPGKSAADVAMRFKSLEEDVRLIEAGAMQTVDLSSAASQPPPAKRIKVERRDPSVEVGPEKRKGVAWSEEEHRLFLLGLAKFGKGDWRSISRHFVLTRTPTQVASHAQKYFIRLNSMKKDRKRASIHDITAPQQQLQQIKAQVRQQQLAAKQQKEAAMLARQRAQQVAQAERQAERQAQAERDRAKHVALETERQQQQELEELQMEFEEQEELYQQQQEQQQQQQQQQQDQHASAFAVPSMQQFDWGLPGVVPSLGSDSSPYDSSPYGGSSYGTSPYDDALLHTTQSEGMAGMADLADWACNLLLPCDPETELQMSKGTPGASSYLLPSSLLC